MAARTSPILAGSSRLKLAFYLPIFYRHDSPVFEPFVLGSVSVKERFFFFCSYVVFPANCSNQFEFELISAQGPVEHPLDGVSHVWLGAFHSAVASFMRDRGRQQV